MTDTKEIRPRLTPDEYNVIENYRRIKSSILVIGDLHLPFIKDGYLEFCRDIRDKYRCDQIMFIGDIVDNHASSFHDTDPDGQSAGDELTTAQEQVHKWARTFPVAKVCVGNHDAIPNRKIFVAGVSNRWLKSPNEVLGVNWEFGEEFIIDDIQYTHGLGKKARMRAKEEMFSVVQGHYHSESYIEYFVGPDRKIFAMQIGCGIDRRSYAMAYGRNFKKPHLNVGVVIDGLPILEYMKL
ncbi:MAG: metallophosphoesterase [Candidatus Dadabacteria bacterium]